MMDDEPERMDPRCDAGGRGYMLWMEYCNDGEYVRATDYDALAAKLAAAEAHIAHLENHIEAVAKDTHKIMMVDLATPLDDPRVRTLMVEALKDAERMLIHYGSRDAGGMAQIRAALSALEENK